MVWTKTQACGFNSTLRLVVGTEDSGLRFELNIGACGFNSTPRLVVILNIEAYGYTETLRFVVILKH